MTSLLVPKQPSVPQAPGRPPEIYLPSLISEAGPEISRRYIEFFLVHLRNKNTRAAYGSALKQFLEWCNTYGLSLESISAISISAYVESHRGSPPTINQHLTAIRSLFRWMVTGDLIDENPAVEVKGIRHKVKIGKTPVLSDDEVKALLQVIDVSHVVGLRDRALIGTMFFSFARISAVLAMDAKDYFPKGKRYWLRLHEKGGRYHEVPAHHTLEQYMDEYVEAAGLADQSDAPLFQTTRGQSRKLTGRRLQLQEALAMVQRKAKAAGISTSVCNHSFRASGITNFLTHGGSLDNAQRIAAHEDSRTTKLYDRRGDVISLDEIERIRL